MAAVAAAVEAVVSVGSLAGPHVVEGPEGSGASPSVGAWGGRGTSLGMMLSRDRCRSLKVIVSFT